MHLILYSINVRNYLNRLRERVIRSERSIIYSSQDAIVIDYNIKLSDEMRIVTTNNIMLTITNSIESRTSSMSFISDIHDTRNNGFKYRLQITAITLNRALERTHISHLKVDYFLLFQVYMHLYCYSYYSL